MYNKLLVKLFVVAGLIPYCFLSAQVSSPVLTGADQMATLVGQLRGKRVAMMVNQTSVVSKLHIVDTLKASGVDIKTIFSPEHGFRGTADAGESVSDAVDARTGISIVSLYGNNRKPTPDQLKNIDIVVFDIQDVGVRFYTYISSLHYLMESCAEQNKKLLILDRPNPNGTLVDGPVLKDKELKSFVGMHSIPIAHGMTIGEYARMINSEGWLGDGRKCDLEIIPLKNWQHAEPYSLGIKPSPNLPNDHSIALYPSTCLFEGTILSIGRGTQNPFELVGHPALKEKYGFQFTPVSIEGMAKDPVLKGQVCFGLDLRKAVVKKGIDLSYLIELYNAFPDKEKFFNNYFNKLAGTKDLKDQIINGMTEEQIKATWQKDLDAFKQIRKKYLLYP
jgi:uncharacterized protein YbbC (DUF1343 family)